MSIMKRTTNILVMLVCVSLFVCATAGASYSVRAVPPENQTDQDAWYFDIVVEPGQKQVLQALVMNMEKEDIQVGVEACTASTNVNGVIEFTGEAERDPSMQVDFAEIFVPLNETVTVPALGEAIVGFALTVPDEAFEGVVYGGLLFTKLGQEAAPGESPMGIANIYRYAIGARIRENEADAEPVFELNGAAMETGDMPALVLNLRNPAPVLARGISLRAELYKGDGEEPVNVFERNGVEMAPNSKAPMRIELFDAEPPEAGEYRMALELKYEERLWIFEMPLNVE